MTEEFRKLILACFDVVSLLHINRWGWYLSIFRSCTDITTLFHHVFIMTLFIHDVLQMWQFVLWTNRWVIMGSLLSLVVTNFFIQKSKQAALQSTSNKPSYCFFYVDTIHLIFENTEKSSKTFKHILTACTWISNLQWTVRRKDNYSYLDVLIIRNGPWGLDCRVFVKSTYTSRCLHKESNHHPGHKWMFMKTLTEWALLVCQSHSWIGTCGYNSLFQRE